MATDHARWISEARHVLQQAPNDYFEVRPTRFWLDFLVSLVIAYAAGTVYLMSPLGSWPQWLAFPVTVFWIYRLGSLVHEVCHLNHREMRAFKVAWNLLVGVNTLAPSPFFTRHHRDHHSQRLYGQPEDPEYIVNVFRRGDVLSLLGYCLLVAAYPLIVFLRFFLAPLSFLHPRLREWVLRRASSLTMNLLYERKLNRFDRWAITAVELLCWLRATTMLAAVALGLTHWTRLPLFYAVALGALTLNQLRLLADHHFETEGRDVDLSEHILDSCNYTGSDFMTWLLFPFAIRYHALHHLFPSLPYHNLRAAHEYLTRHLPADSPYRGLSQPGWWHVARQTLFPRAQPAVALAPVRIDPGEPRMARISRIKNEMSR